MPCCDDHPGRCHEHNVRILRLRTVELMCEAKHHLEAEDGAEEIVHNLFTAAELLAEAEKRLSEGRRG